VTFTFILNSKINRWQFFNFCGVTCRIDQIKIGVLQKRLIIGGGDFGNFF